MATRYRSSVATKVIGVGSGGSHAVDAAVEAGLAGVDVVAALTDAELLRASGAPERILLGRRTCGGAGARGDVGVGRAAALEARAEIAAALAGSDLVVVVAGLGRGTGAGGAAVVAALARQAGALTVGVVTTPFGFEPPARRALAEESLAALEPAFDTLVVLRGDSLLDGSPRLVSTWSAFARADRAVGAALRALADVVGARGTVNGDFGDVRAVFERRGLAVAATGSGFGSWRAAEAFQEAMSSPCLQAVGLEGAAGLLVGVAGDATLTMDEVEDVLAMASAAAGPRPDVVLGSAVDERADGELRVTLIPTGYRRAGAAASARRAGAGRARASRRPAPQAGPGAASPAGPSGMTWTRMELVRPGTPSGDP